MHPTQAQATAPDLGRTGPDPPDASGWRGRVIASLEAGGNYPTWVLLAALAGLFATTFPITILTLALGPIAEEFATSETTVAWVISAPMLLSAVTLPLLGKLGDLYGHRRVFLLGFAGATAVAVATVFAWDIWSLIGLRTLASILGGATQPTSMALIFRVYPASQRVRAMGWWSMTGAAAPALGLILGAPLADGFDWRVVFMLQAAISAVALGLAAVVLTETPRQRVRFDVAGVVTLSIGVGGFMFAVGQLRVLGPESPWIHLATLIGMAGLAVFIRVERHTPEPLMPLTFFRRQNFTAPILSNAFMAAAYMGAFVLAALILTEIFGYRFLPAAIIMLLRTATLTIASPLGGTLGYRIGERGASMVGCGILTLGLCVMAAGVYLHSIVVLGAGLVLQGMGHGLGLPSLPSAIAGTVPESDLGIASAANRLTGQAGAAFGITILTLVYGGTNASSAFTIALLAGAALSLLSFFAAVAMERPARTASGPAPPAPRVD
ncbi:MAG: MFS transporter [Proteobacteria bacterium]|nr:MFS transporter [Pseudomonadota bacterium]